MKSGKSAAEAGLDAVDAAVLVLDAGLKCTLANAAAQAMFLLPQQDPKGRAPGLQRLPQLLHAVEAAASEGTAWEGRLELGDGRWLQAAVSRPPELDGCVVVARDVTETVRVETTRRDFVAALAHELRTPLTSIQGYAELLGEDGEAGVEERAAHLGALQRNVERLSRLARDLVLLASVETGEYPMRIQRLDVGTAARAAMEVMAPLAREHQARLAMGTVAEGEVLADAEALQRILQNLLENAVLHGRGPLHPPPGVMLEIELAGAVRGGEYALEVRDNGAGISSSDQRRVFERFYRVDRNRGATGGAYGTGLGLALVKHLAEEQSGRVELQSELGRGSVFRVLLPRAAGANGAGQ
ncbi:MAG TPA: ATP-binding protein [Terriglobales bacterium]|nr:ATP-binding protein [Terriglobales bacterium]